MQKHHARCIGPDSGNLYLIMDHLSRCDILKMDLVGSREKKSYIYIENLY